MSQLSYAEQAAGFAGMLGDNSEGVIKRVALQGEASAQIAFGMGVYEKTAATATTPRLAAIPSQTGQAILGIVMHSHEYDKRLEMGVTGLLPGTLMTIVEKGPVWVFVDEAVTPASNVFVRYTTNGVGLAGTFRTDGDTSKADRLYGAKFLTSTTGAGLVLLEVDMAAHRAH